MKRMKQWIAVLLSVLVLADSVPLYAAQGSADSFSQPEAAVQESIVEQTDTERTLDTEESSGGTEEMEAADFNTEIMPADGEDSTEAEDLTRAESSIEAENPVETEKPVETENPIEEETPVEEEPVTEVEPIGEENTEGSTEKNTESETETETEPEWHNYFLHLDNDSYELAPGETLKLSVNTNAPQKELVFESLDTTVAVVSPQGVITAVSGGTDGRKSAGIKVSWTNQSNKQDSVSAICYITVQNTISLDKTDYIIYTGQKTTYQLNAKTNPTGNVTWKSSNPSVATVDGTGKIKPIKAGTITITAEANGVSAACKVVVKKPSLKLKSKATIYLKNPVSLEADTAPEATIKWKSSKPSVASVNSKGVVTGKKLGTTTITATANGITKKCKVTVKKPSVSITGANYTTIGSKKTSAVFAGSMIQLYASSEPAVAVKWKTSNKKVAKVDKNGRVTALKTGTATITASIPGAKETFVVKVVKNPYKLNFTSRTMMAGSKATLYVKNLSGIYPAFSQQEYSGSVGLSSEGGLCVINAYEKGTTTVEASFTVYMDGYWVNWWQNCTIKVLDTGISAQQFSIAKNTQKKLKLINAGSANTIETVVWSSSAPKVASIDESTGTVTGKKTGKATIKAAVTYKDGSKKSYSSSMRVSDPKLKAVTVATTVDGSRSIALKGTNAYSDVKWKSKKKSVVTVSPDGVLTPQKMGSATVTAIVDGKTLSCKVYISNPSLESNYSVLAPGRTAKISLAGLSSKSKVTYKSSSPGVAIVNENGDITAQAGGRSKITVNADGKEFSYLVEVASQTAINACIEGNSIMGRSTYSQAYRMTEGYYDCSSLVFRAYGRNTGLLGGSYAWAPTAAGMAQHMANTGKVVSWGPISVEELRPGDLIFYGLENNGRYMGIYHVSMYYGNGYRLEKPMYSYYERSNIVMIARPVP